MPEPLVWSLEQPAEMVDPWQQLIDATDAGDERARDFLVTFGPWAQAELAKRPKS